MASTYPHSGIGMLGVALTFGLTMLTLGYALNHISGCHLNPAVTIGLWAGRRFPVVDVIPYIIVQLIGAIIGAGILYAIASGKMGYELAGNLAGNGYGVYSPGQYSLGAVFLAEAVLSFMFLMIFLGATDERAPQALAPIAIGFGLTLIYLVSIPITNGAINPARSTGPALWIQGWALNQLWLYWVAPIIGAILGGLVYHNAFSSTATQSGVVPMAGKKEYSKAA